MAAKRPAGKGSSKSKAKGKKTGAKSKVTGAATAKKLVKAAGREAKKGGKKGALRAGALILAALLILGGGYIYDLQTFTFSDIFDGIYYAANPPSVPVLSTAVEGELIVHFVDVGQGDAVILCLPDGKNMIVDGGPRKNRHQLFAAIEALSITRFDYVLLTHSDEDHCGGLAYLLEDEKFEFGKIFLPDLPRGDIGTAIYSKFLDAVEKTGAETERSTKDSDIIGGDALYTLDFITPHAKVYEELRFNNAESRNAISPIIIVWFGGRKLMLTGDANERYSEKWFLEAVADAAPERVESGEFDVDVLKVAHHGSGSSTSEAFLRVANPEYAVISYGEGNSYGHPHQSLLARLQQVALVPPSRIYGTAQHGTVTMRFADEDRDGKCDEPYFTTQKAA